MTKIFLATLLITVGFSAIAQKKKNNSTIFKRIIKVGDTERIYGVALPYNYDENKKYPCVYLFHGGGGNMRSFAKKSGWLKTAAEQQMILVMLQAQERCLDRDGIQETKPYWLTKEKENHLCDSTLRDSDLLYLDTVIRQLEESYTADPRRRYACGFSNGMGFILQNILTERPNTFAALGGSGSLIYNSLNANGTTPLYVLLGNLDDRFLKHSDKEYYKIDFDAIVNDPVQGKAIEILKEYYKLDPEPEVIKGEGYIKLDYSNAETQFCYQLLENVGHKFPNGNKKSNGFNVSQILAEYFLQFALE